MTDGAGRRSHRALPDGGTVASSPTTKSGALADGLPSTWTITVPPTPQGIATAVSHLAVAHRTMGPERSHPSARRLPPRVMLGEIDVPAAVRAATPDTGIVLRLQPSIQQLFVAAPLAYYLGAEVQLDPESRPTLTAPAADLTRELPAATFPDAVAGMLRRCFLLDALIREIPAEQLTERSRRLESLGIEADRLRQLDPPDRLRAYLHVTGLDDRLPAWHLATYMGATAEHVRSLPYLLHVLSLVYPADASVLERREHLRRALDGSYRARVDVPSIDVVAPSLAEGNLHAWLADGTPIQAHKPTHRAYEHGLVRRSDESGDHEVAVVVNDPSMAAERAVADIYGAGLHSRPIATRVRENVRTDDLAALFEGPVDFLHYIGHCEVDGLRCPDGHLSVADLEEVRTRTFFLNACGSFNEGRALVERGSTAGAVTLSAVLDEQAATVGTTFARLLVGGFSVAAALDLARRRILMGTDYAVVGDGTVAAIPRTPPPAVLHITPGERDSYEVNHRVSAPRAVGESYPHPFRQGDRLACEGVQSQLDRSELRAFLRRRSLPVLYAGRFYWSEDLAARLPSR